MADEESTGGTRQERREQKLRKQKERIKMHGKNIAQIYRNVISKRLEKND